MPWTARLQKVIHVITSVMLVLLVGGVCAGLVGMSFGWSISGVTHYYPAWLGAWIAVGGVWVWTT